MIAIALAVVAIGTRWSRPEVPALLTVVVVMGLLYLLPSVASLVSHLPLVGSVLLSFGTLPMAFAVAALAGIGLDAIVRSPTDVRVRTVAGVSFGGLAVLLLGIWLFGRGRLPAPEAALRAQSFIWPTIATITGLLAVLWLDRSVRRNRGRARREITYGVAGALLVCETLFLIFSALPLWTSSAHPFRTPPAVQSLQQEVGSSLVGFGASQCIASTFLGGSEPGIVPEANILFGVHELGIYDALIRKFVLYVVATIDRKRGRNAYYNQFCPAVSTVAAARRFGVEYVLEPDGSNGPTGSVRIGRYNDEVLYRIPGSGRATLVPARSGSLPSDETRGRSVAVETPNPTTWEMTTRSKVPGVLRMRLTNVPGWHATIDGRPLKLVPYSGVMLQARVPAGRHKVVLQYWPETFTIGILVAALAVLGVVVALIFAWSRRRSVVTSSRAP